MMETQVIGPIEVAERMTDTIIVNNIIDDVITNGEGATNGMTNGHLEVPEYDDRLLTPVDPASIPRRLHRNKSFDRYPHDPRIETRVLVVYTGGTIGMMRNSQGALVPIPHALESTIRNFHPHLHDSMYVRNAFGNGLDNNSPLVLPDVRQKRRVIYTIYEYDPLLDSSNMTMDDWIRIAQDLKDAYEMFDGFVVLHGTDTLAYTASAVSFMLENLGKSVIFTGSQIPLFETRSDGRDNFLGALILAGNYCIPEVTVYFGHRLFRANRTTKISTGSLNAFDSPNIPPLVTLAIDINVDYKAIFRSTTIAKFRVHSVLNRNVGLLRLFPSITIETVRTFFLPPMQGVILQTYGAGNMPSNRQDLLEEVKKACDNGLLVVNCTQCNQGAVMAGEYETGMALNQAGVIPGSDMTPEAALTKLSYVLSKDEWDIDTKRKMMQTNLRGELTQYSKQMRDYQELELLEAVARSLRLNTSAEVEELRDLLGPSLLCSAVARNDLRLVEAVKDAGTDLSWTDYDGRTALHVASRLGYTDIVEYLLLNGASIHIADKRGNTPLMEAIDFDRFDVITLLRNCGAHVNMDGPRLADCINRAVINGDLKRLQSYQLAGANLNLVDCCGQTALHAAVMADQPSVLRFLRAYGTDQDICNVFNQTPMDLAVALNRKHLICALSESVDVLET